MNLVRIDDSTYINDFCNSESHLLAYSLYYHYKSKSSQCELLVCHDNQHQHAFVHLTTDDGERFLDAHGIHDSLDDVVNCFYTDHQCTDTDASVGTIEPDSSNLQTCIQSSKRYKQYIAPLDEKAKDTYFSELLQSLALHYIWRIQKTLI